MMCLDFVVSGAGFGDVFGEVDVRSFFALGNFPGGPFNHALILLPLAVFLAVSSTMQ